MAMAHNYSVDVTAARIWLSIESAPWEHMEGTPPEYPWFGCKTDKELAASIIDSSIAENLDCQTAYGFRKTLEIMLFG